MPLIKSSTQNELFWQLSIAVNAAFKGLLGSMGQSGHICSKVLFVKKKMDIENGWENLMHQIIAALPSKTKDGDVIVIPDKIVAVSLKRTGPREIILSPDPKTVAVTKRIQIAKKWSKKLGFSITQKQLLLADEYKTDLVSLGVDDHNLRCFDLAELIWELKGIKVDVIISDTDTGLDVREPLIGTITIAASPLGATKGVNLYEAMRCAVAAEFVRGHNKMIPIVICIPAQRRKARPGIGKKRSYPGLLDVAKENSIAHA